MKNIEIRNLIKKNRLYYYEVADEIGISQVTFCIWLRKELTEVQKQKVLAAIADLTTGNV